MKSYIFKYKNQISIKVFIFIIIALCEIALFIYFLSGKLETIIQITDTLKAVVGAVFSLSLITTTSVFKSLISRNRIDSENNYDNLLREIEIKYSIYNNELEKQKNELNTKIGSKDEIDNLLKEQLYKIERESIELQSQKYNEIRDVMEKIKFTK